MGRCKPSERDLRGPRPVPSRPKDFEMLLTANTGQRGSISLNAWIWENPAALLTNKVVAGSSRQGCRCRGRFLSGSGDEHVADAAHGADNVRVGWVGLYLPP